MLDDAVLMQRRQTKRKWKQTLILILIALASLTGAWGAAHPQYISGNWHELLARILPQQSGEWVQTDYGPETCAFSLQDDIFFAEVGSITALQSNGATLYREVTSFISPQAMLSKKTAALFEPGGTELLLVTSEGITPVDIPLGIDTAAVSDLGTLAVVTAGSGYQTVTRWYDAQGNILRELGFRDKAMVLMTFLNGSDTLAACSITPAGQWILQIYSGENTLEYTLDVSEVYDLKPCGQGVAIWTCNGICIFSAQAMPNAQLDFSPERLLAWDSDSFAAIVLWEQGRCVITTLTESGKQFKSEPLCRTPINLSVCASRLCVLDREALLFYDMQCIQQDATSQGALAADVQAVPGGAVLLGSSQFMRYFVK